MSEHWSKSEERDHASYWPAFADMAAATCVVLVIFWIAGTWALQRERNRSAEALEKLSVLEISNLDLEDLIERLNSEINKLKQLLELSAEEGGQLEFLNKEITKLEIKIQDLEKLNAEKDRRIAELRIALGRGDMIDRLENEKLQLESRLAEVLRNLSEIQEKFKSLQELHKEPPNIVLSEGKDYTFSSGTAEITAEFTERFRKNEMAKIIEALNSPSNVEIVEVVGHTDLKPIPKGRPSNLDLKLSSVFGGGGSISTLSFGSNTDLGMARAVAVKGLIEECLKEIEESNDGRLSEAGAARISKLVFRTYSAAHLFPAAQDERESDPVGASGEGADLESDRRIEIRFTRFK